MQLIDFILHIDEHLVYIVNDFGNWTYLILFAMVFIETGVVIFPFLPGDSLLFAACALAANSAYHLNVWLFFGLFLAAAVIGDTVNYEIGKHVGLAASNSSIFGRLINREKLASAKHFFNKHGGKTIAIARFMPLIRTFAPFVAGAGSMNYKFFLTYNVIGAFCWIASFITLGYIFGNMPIVKDNFTHLIFGIIIISILPGVIGFVRQKLNERKAQ